MKSFIYEGQVKHRRFLPRTHQFNYPLFLVYIDLDELTHVFDRFWLWSTRFNLAWFKRDDHLGDEHQSLHQSVRDRIEAETGERPNGPVRLLTHFRYLGFGFNPVSFYYCFDEADQQLETIICEVNNTPWGEQHIYVLDEKQNIGNAQHKRYQRSKEFHVSPFMPMDIEYDWRFSMPGKLLNVHMENYHSQEKIFDATLLLKRVPMTSFNMARVLVQYPIVTLKVVLAIYYQAIKLWLKKIPIFSHPNDKQKSQEA